MCNSKIKVRLIITTWICRNNEIARKSFYYQILHEKCLRQLPSFFFKHEHDNFCALEFIVFNFHNSIGISYEFIMLIDE